MAVRLYVNNKSISDKMEIVENNDNFFDSNIHVDMLDEVDQVYMRKYDGAVIMNDSTARIITKFGQADLKDLSTGLKTLLNVRYVGKHGLAMAVNITSCGENILDDVFDEAEQYSVKLVTKNYRLLQLKHREFLFQDISKVNTPDEIFELVVEELNHDDYE